MNCGLFIQFVLVYLIDGVMTLTQLCDSNFCLAPLYDKDELPPPGANHNNPFGLRFCLNLEYKNF